MTQLDRARLAFEALKNTADFLEAWSKGYPHRAANRLNAFKAQAEYCRAVISESEGRLTPASESGARALQVKGGD